MNKALVDALNSTELKARMQALAVETMPGAPAQTAEYAERERERRGKVVKADNIRIA